MTKTEWIRKWMTSLDIPEDSKYLPFCEWALSTYHVGLGHGTRWHTLRALQNRWRIWERMENGHIVRGRNEV